LGERPPALRVETGRQLQLCEDPVGAARPCHL